MKNTLILAFVITLAGCFGKEPEKTGNEGKALPSFKIILQDSTTYFDTKDIPEGKPVVLFLFGPHCPYSRAQMEEILYNMKTLKDIQFYVLTTWSFSDLNKAYNYYQLKKYPNIVAGIDYSNFIKKYFVDSDLIGGLPLLCLRQRHLGCRIRL